MSKILCKLNEIQTKLTAPKGQYNKFGKYNYRSCEDILKAVTPHLKETQTTLVVSDDIKLVGDRYYLVATATLTCCEDDGYISVNGMAREDENKKGMDASQLTGSTSSYARKYALNALFAIDDTKDADATNKHEKTAPRPQKQQTKPPVKPPVKPTQKKLDENDDMLNSIKNNIKALKTIDDVNTYATDIASIVGNMLNDYQILVKEVFATRRKEINAK